MDQEVAARRHASCRRYLRHSRSPGSHAGRPRQMRAPHSRRRKSTGRHPSGGSNAGTNRSATTSYERARVACLGSRRSRAAAPCTPVVAAASATRPATCPPEAERIGQKHIRLLFRYHTKRSISTIRAHATKG